MHHWWNAPKNRSELPCTMTGWNTYDIALQIYVWNICLNLSLSWKGEKSKMSIHDPSQQWCMQFLDETITSPWITYIENYPEGIEFSWDKSLISRRGKRSVQLSLLWTKEVTFQGMSRRISRWRSRGQLFFLVVSVDFWNLNLCEICWWCMGGQSISIVLSYFHFFLLDVVQQKCTHFAHGQGSVLLQRISYSIDAGQLYGSNIFSLDYEIYIWLVGLK
jgi:hypothetical protein